MAVAKVTITKKHKYSMGAPDAGGNKLIYVTGEITMSSFSKTTTTTGLEFDLSTDIPNLEGIFIQGDGGYTVQYNYSTTAADRKIEIYGWGEHYDTSTHVPLNAMATASTLAFLVFKFHAWGF
jgi:hypothetical protein